MKFTKTHLEYWAKRKAPKWAREISAKSPHPTIDAIVNANAGFTWKDGEAQAHNMMPTLLEAIDLLETVSSARACQDHEFDVDAWFKQVRSLLGNLK